MKAVIREIYSGKCLHLENRKFLKSTSKMYISKNKKKPKSEFSRGRK